MGQFYYAAKAFDVLERLDPNPEYWEGKRGACVGIFQQIIAGHEPRLDSSRQRTRAPGVLPQVSDRCRPRRVLNPDPILRYHTLYPGTNLYCMPREYPLPCVCLSEANVFENKNNKKVTLCCFNKAYRNFSCLLRTITIKTLTFLRTSYHQETRTVKDERD